MRNEFSLAHLSALSLSPPEMVDVAARTGYQYVGLRLNPVTPSEPRYLLATDPEMMRETCAALADTGIGVLDIELARLTPDVDIASFQAMLEAGARLGARHVITQTPDAERSRAVEHFASFCELARQYSLTAELEFVTWTATSDLETAAAIVRETKQPNAGILVDTLHFCRSRCQMSLLERLPAAWFRFAQVCDAPAEAPTTTEALIHAARNERRLLGDGGLDVRGILHRLPAGIPYSLEIPMTTLGRTLAWIPTLGQALTPRRR